MVIALATILMGVGQKGEGDCVFQTKVGHAHNFWGSSGRHRGDFLVNVCFHVSIKVNMVNEISISDFCSQPNRCVCV